MSIGSNGSKATLRGGYWFLSGDPHVLHRAVKILNGAKREGGEVKVRATDENAADLMWFAQRFPVKFTPEIVLRCSAGRYKLSQRKLSQILAEGYKPTEVEFAPGLAPKPHQVIAADLVKASRRLLLADELGTGKTASALAMIADSEVRPTAVICPPALELQWARSIRQFLPGLTVHQIDGRAHYDLTVMKRCGCGEIVDSRRLTRYSRLYCPKCSNPIYGIGRYPDVILCSYSKVDAWAPYLAKAMKSVVFEECHALRRSESNKWQGAKTIADAVPIRLGLSATPIYNYGGEAWNVMECIAPGFLGDKTTFRETWCRSYGNNGKEPPLINPEAFGAYLRSHGVMLRRTAAECGIESTDHKRITISVQSDMNAFRDIQGRAAELARIILDDSKKGRGEAMEANREFDQMMRQATGLAKAPYVADFVELILEQDIPVVMFAHHRAVHNFFEERLARWRPAFYTGEETHIQKEASVARFRNGDTPLFIAALRSGEGLDGLQFRAWTNVVAELDWAPACISQCLGRTARQGQTKPVMSYFPLSDFGSDPLVSQALGLKQSQADGVLGTRAVGPVRKIDEGSALRELASKFLASTRRSS